MRLLSTVMAFLWMTMDPAFCAVPSELNYHIYNWQTEDGLPQNRVQFIAQTLDGYLWLATPNTLSRFDGRQFQVFRCAEIPELRTRSITCLFGDRAGRLWIGAQERLLCYADGEFTTYTPPEGSKLGDFTEVTEDASGTLYGLALLGLYHIEPRSRCLIPIPNPLGYGAKLAADARGRVWLSTGNSLCLLDKGKWLVQQNFPFVIYSLMADRHGTIWCGLDGGVIVQLDERGDAHNFKMGNGTVYGIFETHSNEVFVWMDRSLHHFPEGDVIDLPLPNGRSLGRILDVFEDREGNLWIGSDGNGLALLRRKLLRTYSIEQGLSHQQVTAVVEDKQGRIWTGTKRGGLSTLESGRWHDSEFPFTRGVGSLCAARDGSLWVGTYGNHLWHFQNGISQLETRSRALAARAIFEDTRGGLWIGGDGMGIECLTDGRTTRFDTGNGLRTDRTRCFAEDVSGAVWAGTEQGLYRITGELVQGYFSGQGLASDSITTLCWDAQGTLWIGTADSGLTRYREGQFATINSRQGLLEDTVAQILEDDQGHLWLGGNRGLFRVRREDLNKVLDGLAPRLHGRAFGKAEGMRNLECTAGFQPNCMKANDGRLWFCTADGLVVMDPKGLPISEIPPPVHIERFVVDGVELGGESLLFSRTISAAPDTWATPESAARQTRTKKVIWVPPGAKRLEFHYTGISFSALEKVRFKYKLEGYDHDWNESDLLGPASYTLVPPGDYVFRVQAANPDGVWNPQLAQLTFAVRPQFWQTWWFQGISGLTAAALVFGFSYSRIHRRREIERLRLRIARDLHDEVGSHLGTISLYNQLAQSKTPGPPSSVPELQEIDRVVQRTAQSLRDVIWFINPEFDTIGGMLEHMEDTAGRTLIGKTILFQAESPFRPRPLTVEFRRNMFFIFRELLHNLLKHSQAGRVEIAVSEKGQTLVLQVTDDGVGFDALTVRVGHGLKTLKQRAAALGGVFEIESRPGHGTKVRLAVPLT
jgi:ligand-binding sensor domain-containing protein